MSLNFMKLNIDVLTPPVDHNSHFVTTITKMIENCERPFCRAYPRNVQRQYDEDVISNVERGDTDRIKGVRKVQNNAVIFLSEQMKNLGNVIGVNLLGFMGLGRCGNQRQMS